MTKKYIDADILRAYMKTFLTGNDLYTQNGIESFVESLPAADIRAVGNIEHEMAVILADLIGCPCDYGDIGETLCEVCEIIKPGSYCTSDDVACWEQYLKHREEVQG